MAISKYSLIMSLIIVSFFTISGFTAEHVLETDNEFKLIVNSDQYTLNGVPSLICKKFVGHESESRECTVRIKNEDMDIELTLHDVGRWDCFKLKARALWYSVRGKI